MNCSRTELRVGFGLAVFGGCVCYFDCGFVGCLASKLAWDLPLCLICYFRDGGPCCCYVCLCIVLPI